jgi:hypothetical protein
MTDDLEQLQRWETSGGHWRVLGDDGTTLTISMVTCDGGEEMAQLVSAEATLREYVGGRSSSEVGP